MKQVSKNSIDYYILPNKILCSVLGVSPSDQEYSTCGKIFAYFRLMIAIAAVSSIVLPQIMLLAISWDDLKVLTGNRKLITGMAQIIQYRNYRNFLLNQRSEAF